MTEKHTDYQILPAGLKDLNSLRGLEKLCFPLDAWPFLDMIGALTLPNIVRFKLEMDGKLVGFIAGDIRKFQRVGWIATVAVHPEYRRRGFAEILLEICEIAMEMPRVKLTVRASNVAAIMLYRRNGYIQVGRWKNYYQGGEDGVVMEKAIL